LRTSPSKLHDAPWLPPSIEARTQHARVILVAFSSVSLDLRQQNT
jgi:hypothetical protein